MKENPSSTPSEDLEKKREKALSAMKNYVESGEGVEDAQQLVGEYNDALRENKTTPLDIIVLIGEFYQEAGYYDGAMDNFRDAQSVAYQTGNNEVYEDMKKRIAELENVIK